MKSEWIVDDSHEIPQRILDMSEEECRKEIARLKEEARIKREARNRQSAVS